MMDRSQLPPFARHRSQAFINKEEDNGTGTRAAARHGPPPVRFQPVAGLRACERRAYLPIRAFPCKHSGHVRIALLAYRCGGSSGLAAQAAHRIPVSTAGITGSHLRPQHLRARHPACI